MASIGGLQIDFNTGQAIMVIGYIIFLFIFLAIVGFIGYILTFRYNVTEAIMTGDGNKGYSVTGFRNNKGKIGKTGTHIKLLYPLFNNKKYLPPQSTQIYANKRIFYFDFTGTKIPGEIKIMNENGQPLIFPNRTHLKEFQINMHKEHAREFALTDWWSENKMLIFALVTCIFCLAACGLTVYLTYNFATGGTVAINGLSESIKNIGVVPGVPPA